MRRIRKSFARRTGLGMAAAAALCLGVAAFLIFGRGGGAPGDGALAQPAGAGARVHQVRLTERGFEPDLLRVNLGDSVQFVSDLAGPFWPASDLHPTHEIYPGFDPRRAVPPEDTWTFTFEREGVWSYHDHLHSEYTGRIEAGGPSGIRPDCDLAGDPYCWRKELEANLKNEVRTKGVTAALELLMSKYEANAEWQSSCHAMGHAIGKEGYDIYAAGKNLDLDDKVAFCSYGFYHGFMEELLNRTGDPAVAKKFCEEGHLGEGAIVSANCFHGIGHALANNHDPATWDDPKKMLLPALALCDSITPDQRVATDCYNGAFAGINEFYSTGKYNLPIPKDPFGFCESLEQRYRSECYVAANIAVMVLVNNDFASALALADRLPDAESVAAYMRSLVAPIAGGLNSSDFKKAYVGFVQDCEELRAEWRDPCLKGLFGYIGLGLSEYAYAGGLEICSSPGLAGIVREDCYKYLLRNGGNRVKFPAQFKAACEQAPAEFKKYCE